MQFVDSVVGAHVGSRTMY